MLLCTIETGSGGGLAADATAFRDRVEFLTQSSGQGAWLAIADRLTIDRDDRHDECRCAGEEGFPRRLSLFQAELSFFKRKPLRRNEVDQRGANYGELRVAVGTPIAERPPHRSRRAAFPHRAPVEGRT